MSECIVGTCCQREKALVEVLAPLRSGPTFPDFLTWIADRLVNVHKESEHVDFVITLRDRAALLRAALGSTPDQDFTEADVKKATLHLTLKADSGYIARSEGQISPNQWAAITAILEQK